MRPNKPIIIALMIIIPVSLIYIGSDIWDKYTFRMSLENKENLLAKVTIAGTIITSVAIIYSVFFNVIFP
jgi:hypothetical protein